jgi:hypothetical protein
LGDRHVDPTEKGDRWEDRTDERCADCDAQTAWVADVPPEVLLALSVAPEMAVMQTMFEAEITAVVGPKGKHDPDRAAVRHGGREEVVGDVGRPTGAGDPAAGPHRRRP